MIVVLDANVVVSAHISVGPPTDVFRRWQAREFEVLISAEILAEYDRVLRYSHLRRLHGPDEAGIELIIAAFAESATVVSPTERLSVIPDETDNRFIARGVGRGAVQAGGRQRWSYGLLGDARSSVARKDASRV